MPEPTNPRKKALMPSGPLRRNLRAAGHHLSPIVQVGKEGVTEAVLRQLDQALTDHELVKVKVGTESPEDRFEAAARLGEGAQLAQILGRTALVYRRHPDHPRYEPKPAEPREKALARAAAAKKAPARKGPARNGPERKKPARKGPERKGQARTGPERKGPARKGPERKAAPPRPPRSGAAKKVSGARPRAPRAAARRPRG